MYARARAREREAWRQRVNTGRLRRAPHIIPKVSRTSSGSHSSRGCTKRRLARRCVVEQDFYSPPSSPRKPPPLLTGFQGNYEAYELNYQSLLLSLPPIHDLPLIWEASYYIPSCHSRSGQCVFYCHDLVILQQLWSS